MPSNSQSPFTNHSEEFKKNAANLKHDFEELGHLTATVAQESVHQLKHEAQEMYQQGKTRFVGWEDQLRERIREKPLESAMIVAGAAFVLGAFWRRRR